MRVEKLFKVLVVGALFSPALMCTSATGNAPASAAGKATLARSEAATDAGVIAASATDAIVEAAFVEENVEGESEGVGSWLSW